MNGTIIFGHFLLNFLMSKNILKSFVPENGVITKRTCALKCNVKVSCKTFCFHQPDSRCLLSKQSFERENGLSPVTGIVVYSKQTYNDDPCMRTYVYDPDGVFCYLDFSDEKVTWSMAREKCSKTRGMLIKADNEHKHNLITKIAKQKGYPNLWIGASRENDASGTQIWKWVDGTLVTNDYWQKSGQDHWPMNTCLQYSKKEREYDWDDTQCFNRRGFLCESPMSK